MLDIYIIEYKHGLEKQIVAILEDSKLVEAFLTNMPSESKNRFSATHYKKDPSGVLTKVYTHPPPRPPPTMPPLLPLLPLPSPPPLAKIRIPKD